MAKTKASLELQAVPLNTRFRKFAGGKRDKVRQRAKIEVVQIGENQFGVTVRRGIVTVFKGTVAGASVTGTSVMSSIRRAVKKGDYDTALFDDYAKIVADKSAKKPKAKK